MIINQCWCKLNLNLTHDLGILLNTILTLIKMLMYKENIDMYIN